ncbi:MAG TPA: hypothetical protein VMM81_06810 [Acidimicrobiia bacterium]|nr:hypothetical protein [Acidimicrobiia bacterium]
MSRPSILDLPESRPLASAARSAAHSTALRSAAMALASALLALPLAAEPGDLDPTYGGGDGYELFDLGGNFAICAVDVTADGTIVLAANTAGGSEIWRVDADGTNVALVRSYSFAGAPDCDQGLRALTCPDGGTSCYGAGSRSVGGDDDTWVVAFDWRTGLADPGILSQGEVIVDFEPGGSDGAYAVNAFPPQGEPEEILTAGTAGDFGLTARFKRGEPVTGNTVMISGQTTVIRWQEVAAGVAESLEVGHRNGVASRAGEVEGLRWKAGETIFAGDRYVGVCREKLVGGEWVNDERFGDGGCGKELSTAKIRGFKVVDGRPVLLLQEGEAFKLQVVRADGNGLAEDPVDVDIRSGTDLDSVELVTAGNSFRGFGESFEIARVFIVVYNHDRVVNNDGAFSRSIEHFELTEDGLEWTKREALKSAEVNLVTGVFFVKYLTGVDLFDDSSASRTLPQSGAPRGPSPPTTRSSSSSATAPASAPTSSSPASRLRPRGATATPSLAWAATASRSRWTGPRRPARVGARRCR